ncbi:MAG: class I SAM-dependent methyltransferase, partial [Myxococcota bacterium]
MSTTRKKGGLKPHFEDVQAHYDLSDEFFSLFLDPTQTYSCAYFERDDMSLEEAQLAKVDLALGKLGLEPGMTLLDVGCGWGSTLLRAIEKYDVNVVGLTLSKNQAAHVEQRFAVSDSPRSKRVLLQGWEQFDEPVDRIISLEAIEAFPPDRYAPFFKTCSSILPGDGRMVLQAILGHPLKKWPELGIPVTMTDLRFMRFIAKEIFPGGSVPGEEQIVTLAQEAGFAVEDKQLLDEHYVR